MEAGQHFCDACQEAHYSTIYRDLGSENRHWRCVIGFFALTTLERAAWQEAAYLLRSDT